MPTAMLSGIFIAVSDLLIQLGSAHNFIKSLHLLDTNITEGGCDNVRREAQDWKTLESINWRTMTMMGRTYSAARSAARLGLRC